MSSDMISVAELNIRAPFSQPVVWQVSRFSSELSPQSLSPSQSWRLLTQTFVDVHL